MRIRPGTKRSRATWMLAAALLCVLGASARATQQEGRQPVPNRLGDDLDARDRGFMHPDLEPSVVVGLEQGGNSFRHRTPGLAQGNLASAMVDFDENRARRLALFEGRVFMRTVRPPGSYDFGDGHDEGPGTLEPAPVDDAGDVSESPMRLLVLGFVLGVALVWTVQHKLRARLASIS